MADMTGGRALFLILAVGAGACSLFHHGPTPQQKLFDALNRGNAPQATQIWLHMTPEDRMKFSRGQGITPAVPPKQALKMLSQMPPDQMEGQITITPPASGGSLLDLPALATRPPSAPASTPMEDEDQQQYDEQP